MSAPRPVRLLPSLAPVPISSVQGTLALDLTPQLTPPDPRTPEGVRPRGVEADVVAIESPLRRRFEEWARRYGQAAVEVAAGARPAAQLRRWTADEVFADLTRRSHLIARAAGQPAAGAGRDRGFVRPQVVGVHCCFVTPTVCEVGYRVRHGERSRAVAARFEALPDGRWQCTALEFA